MSSSRFVKLCILLNILNKSYSNIRTVDHEEECLPEGTFLVQFRSGNDWFCTGTLLNEKYVLTAASCLDVDGVDYKKVTISYSREHRSAINVSFTHPEYVSFPHLFHDVAVVKLTETFPESREVAFVTLPKPNCLSPIQSLCTEGDIFSFDIFIPADEFFVECDTLPLISKNECEKQFFTKEVRDRGILYQFCTISEEYTQPICDKDQGSAIICNGVQIGIASIVDKVSCYKGEVPTGFTRIDCYLKFIYTSMLNSGGEKYVANSGISLNDANLEVDYDLSDIQVYTCRNFTYERMCLSDRTIQKSSENGKKGESEHGSTGSTDGCSGSEDRYSSRSEDGYSRSEDGYSRSEDGYSRSDRDSGDGDRNSRDENKVIDMNKGSNFLKISTFGMILQLSLVSLISFSSSFILLTIVF